MESRRKNSVYGILFILALVIPLTFSIPPLPTDFYGTATIYNLNRTPLPIGTQINIFAGNVSCGSFSVINPGYYGLLTCTGEDDYTNDTEGAIFGQNILFYLGNETAQTFGDTVWYYGDYRMVNVTPVPRCPNGWCELTESCITCAEDCGRCPSNVTGNGTGGGGGNGSTSGGSSGGGASGGSSSGGGGGGSGGSGGGGSFSGGGEGYTGSINLSMSYCQEDWVCTEWRPDECPPEELFERDCTDRNVCGTEYQKPALNQSCTYLGTCFDFFLNQDETDVDCGGTKCEPCENGLRCNFDIDCKSGFCHPTENICLQPACNDDFRNQGEEGVDCGGPCPPCERPTLEKPGTIARFIVRGCGPFPWVFVLVSSLITLLIFIAGRAYIEKIKNSKEYKKLRKLEQLRRLYDLKRDLNAFVLISILLEIAVALYWYYLCEIAIWLFLVTLIIIPLIIAILLKSYVYDEKRKTEKLRKLVLRHEDNIKKIISIEREEIKKEEDKAYRMLSEGLDYSKLDKNLALLFKDVRFIIGELLSTKEENPFEVENSLADAIKELGDEKNKETILADENLAKIWKELVFIEKIHRDILLQYKKLQEEQEIEKELEKSNSSLKGKIIEMMPAGETDKNKPESEEGHETNGATGAGPGEKDTGSKLEPDKEFFDAVTLHKNSQLDSAEEAYKNILSKRPDDKKVLYSLASLYNQKKRFSESFALYSKIVSLDPGYLNAKAYYEKLKSRYSKKEGIEQIANK